jgi:hypothetical protein
VECMTAIEAEKRRAGAPFKCPICNKRVQRFVRTFDVT